MTAGNALVAARPVLIAQISDLHITPPGTFAYVVEGTNGDDVLTLQKVGGVDEPQAVEMLCHAVVLARAQMSAKLR